MRFERDRSVMVIEDGDKRIYLYYDDEGCYIAVSKNKNSKSKKTRGIDLELDRTFIDEVVRRKYYLYRIEEDIVSSIKGMNNRMFEDFHHFKDEEEKRRFDEFELKKRQENLPKILEIVEKYLW